MATKIQERMFNEISHPPPKDQRLDFFQAAAEVGFTEEQCVFLWGMRVANRSNQWRTPETDED